MTSTSTTVPTPIRPRSVKHYTILIALVLALAAGIFAVYAATSSPADTTAPSSVQIDNSRAGGGGCSASSMVGGGLVEGQSVGDTCDAAGGSGIRGGVQP